MRHPVTPDGRYFLVRGRLWRCTDPSLDEQQRRRLVNRLMAARRAAKSAAGDPEKLVRARQAVHEAKVALGERGAVWWDDGQPDYNCKLASNTPYAAWAAAQDES